MTRKRKSRELRLLQCQASEVTCSFTNDHRCLATPPSHKARLLAWLLLLIPVVVALLYPLAQDYLRAASVLDRISDPHATGWIANYDVHPVDVRDTTFDFRGKSIPARIYLPRGVGFAPGIVVVHGMHQLGIDEPRLVGFARSLAASGFFVMTPLGSRPR